MVGIDLVSIQEFKQQLELGGETFLRRAFHASECINDSVEHLAGIWAAKEAVMKATGLAAGRWLDITISYADSGKPIATVAGRFVEISIAHHKDYAVAVAMDMNT
jgi:phosphopantetheine--protein transferase-like protein